MNPYFQTGDILYFTTSLPKDISVVENGVILHSDTTGNTHKVHNGLLYRDKDGKMYITAKENTTLTHPEHKDLKLPEGDYELRIVKEYDHLLEESRNVID